jgi:hypothetical protein
MTILDAGKKGIRQVRSPQWNDKAYLTLPPFDGETFRDFTLYLIDPDSSEFAFHLPRNARLILYLWEIGTQVDEWEPFTGTVYPEGPRYKFGAGGEVIWLDPVPQEEESQNE